MNASFNNQEVKKMSRADFVKHVNENHRPEDCTSDEAGAYWDKLQPVPKPKEPKP